MRTVRARGPDSALAPRRDQTAVTDAGLAHLKGLQKLTALSLRESNVTDAGLQSLKPLENLVVLEATRGRITRDGLDGLKAELPNLDFAKIRDEE